MHFSRISALGKTSLTQLLKRFAVVVVPNYADPADALTSPFRSTLASTGLALAEGESKNSWKYFSTINRVCSGVKKVCPRSPPLSREARDADAARTDARPFAGAHPVTFVPAERGLCAQEPGAGDRAVGDARGHRPAMARGQDAGLKVARSSIERFGCVGAPE